MDGGGYLRGSALLYMTRHAYKTRLPGSDGKRSERGRWWIEVDFKGKRTLVVRNKTRPPAGCSP